MIDQLSLSIGIGLAVSLIFSEIFGLAAGGMIVPGYMALSLTRPMDVLLTLVAAIITYAIVHTLASVMVVYGRRLTVLMILTGYIVGAILRWAAQDWIFPTDGIPDVIGFIIPGLIATWFERQGVFETIASLATASVVVRLVLVLVVGEELWLL